MHLHRFLLIVHFGSWIWKHLQPFPHLSKIFSARDITQYNRKWFCQRDSTSLQENRWTLIKSWTGMWFDWFYICSTFPFSSKRTLQNMCLVHPPLNYENAYWERNYFILFSKIGSIFFKIFLKVQLCQNIILIYFKNSTKFINALKNLKKNHIRIRFHPHSQTALSISIDRLDFIWTYYCVKNKTIIGIHYYRDFPIQMGNRTLKNTCVTLITPLCYLEINLSGFHVFFVESTSAFMITP